MNIFNCCNTPNELGAQSQVASAKTPENGDQKARKNKGNANVCGNENRRQAISGTVR